MKATSTTIINLLKNLEIMSFQKNCQEKNFRIMQQNDLGKFR